MEIKDHAVDISSDHDESAPNEANSVAHDPQTSVLTTACSDYTVIGTDATAILAHQQPTSENNKHDNLSQNDDQQVDGCKKISCRNVAAFKSIMLICIICFLIVSPLAIIVIPFAITCLVIGYWITRLTIHMRYDDYSDVDDAYDTDLGSYLHTLVLWMTGLTGILIIELVVYLAIFMIGPSTLNDISLLDHPIWKWFVIEIIFLMYFGLWCLGRLLLHCARECSTKNIFLRVHVFPIYEGFLGVAVWGLYFLVEFLVFKVIALSKIFDIVGHRSKAYVHGLVCVFIVVNIGRILSASIIALSHKHCHLEKFANCLKKDAEAPRSPQPSSGKKRRHDLYDIPYFKVRGPTFIMKKLFRNFDTSKFTIYLVVGLTSSINFVFVSIWLLWILTLDKQYRYFTHKHKLENSNAAKIELGIVGFLICLPISAVLWLLKNSIMLWWEYRSIYHQFYDQVLDARTQLYLLGMICRQGLDVLKIERSDNEEDEEEKKKKTERIVGKARTVLEHDMTPMKKDIYAMKRMVRYFLVAKDAFKKSMNAGIDKLIENCCGAQGQNSRAPLESDNIKEVIGKELRKEDFDSLVRQIRDELQIKREEVRLQDFKGWMKISYKNCYNITNKLARAQRLSDYLNQVMTAVIILITFSIWIILVTRSTTVITLFGAPIAALSFIFGDTVAVVFKGIIFLYVIHPYDIGDICFIQKIMYEVKESDFWETTFVKVETNEEVLYPHSALFNESIININMKNNKGLLDDSDSIELSLESDTDEQTIEEVQRKINDCLKESQKIRKARTAVKYDFGKPITVTIDFKHNLSDFHFESNNKLFHVKKERKQELRSNIVEQLPELKSEAA